MISYHMLYPASLFIGRVFFFFGMAVEALIQSVCCHVIVVFCSICWMLNCFFSLSPYLREHARSSTVYSVFARTAQRTWQPSNHSNRSVIHAKGRSAVYEGGDREIDCLRTVLAAEVACGK
jgi:hypothetical protein